MSSLGPEDKPPYSLIKDDAEARAALEYLQNSTLVGLDTETFWESATKHSRISLVQIAPLEGEVQVFDALSVDLEILRPLIESEAIQMAAHNARFDEEMLMRAGFRPISFIDTLRLARASLRLPSYSLAGVSSHLFGIELDKSFQKSNWRRRPLTRAQLDYAALDAHIVLHVFLELKRQLAEKGKLDEALRFATLTPAAEKTENKRPRRRIAPQPPLRPLTAEEKRLLSSLKKWRLEKSSRELVPAYMICPDKTLEQLAMERPSKLEDLNNIHGLGASRIARFGEELLAALRDALSTCR